MIASIDATATTMTNSPGLEISRALSSNYFTGNIADVRISNVALIDSEIKFLYLGKNVQRGLAIQLSCMLTNQ